MERDDRVVVFGEDVGYFGGVFRCTQGLQERFGKHRCFDTPINEAGHRRRRDRHGGVRPAAVRRDPVRRLHVSGLRPDRVRGGPPALPLRRRLHGAARRSGCRPAAGSTAARRTRRARRRCSPTSSGLKTVVVSNPYDAKGLLIAAIEDDDPVIFLEPKRLYNGPFDGHHDRPIVPWSKHPLGEVPEGHYTIELGTARVHRAGRRTDGADLRHARPRRRGRGRRRAASTPRSSICARSCRSTSTRSSSPCARPDAASSLHEATLTSGFGAELSATVQERVLLPPRGAGRRGCAAGTRRTRTPTSGRTSPDPSASAGRCSEVLSA